MSDAGANPFNPRVVLAMVLFGAVTFFALLWMIGAGMTGGSTNDGGGHAGGKGLNGYAALASFLERRGMAIRRVQSKGALSGPELLVLTPPHQTDPKELDRIVGARHVVGPTMIILPKWITAKVPPEQTKGKKGWVFLAGAMPVEWPGFRDDVSLALEPGVKGGKVSAQGSSTLAVLPDGSAVQSGGGNLLVPLLVSQPGGRILAGYIDDGGAYPWLEDMALAPPASLADDEDIFPLVMVFEPDLLNNFGMKNPANAQLAEQLIRAASGDADGPVIFDLTFNGHARSANLLTLAFTPPFLAATLCLLIAAIALGWRAFLRFGPPRAAVRAIAFGKRALVANAAGLIRRTRRLHLVTAPYADQARERLARALALPRLADGAATEAAIDRALAGRKGNPAPFSTVARRLRNANRPNAILEAAQDLHALERTLKR